MDWSEKREQTYGPMAAEYREKVARALRDGGVDAAEADRIVDYWKGNLRAAWSVAMSPRAAAKDLAKYEGIVYRPPPVAIAPRGRRRPRAAGRRR